MWTGANRIRLISFAITKVQNVLFSKLLGLLLLVLAHDEVDGHHHLNWVSDLTTRRRQCGWSCTDIMSIWPCISTNIMSICPFRATNIIFNYNPLSLSDISLFSIMFNIVDSCTQFVHHWLQLNNSDNFSTIIGSEGDTSWCWAWFCLISVKACLLLALEVKFSLHN